LLLLLDATFGLVADEACCVLGVATEEADDATPLETWGVVETDEPVVGADDDLLVSGSTNVFLLALLVPAAERLSSF
jgi:hypothetical protein